MLRVCPTRRMVPRVAEATPRIRAVWLAEGEPVARKLAAALVRDWRSAAYDRAAECLEGNLDRCLTFFWFPRAHWIHLRTTNVIESVFASVWLRTNADKRFKKTRSGVYLMHQVLLRLSTRWRRLCSAHLYSTIDLPNRRQIQKGTDTQAA